MAHLLSAYIERPERITFESQLPDETIILLLRAHPITNVPWIIIGILLILFPFALMVLPIGASLPVSPADLQQALNIFAVVFEFVAFGYIFEQFLNYYFSVYIVTNIRIIDIDFFNILNKKVSDTQLAEIEDVTYTQNGIFRAIFNYGDVVVQTAGTNPEFLFRAVPRPDDVAQVMNELQPPGGS